MPARIFIHGLESSNKGTKSVFFRDIFPDMIIPHFTGDLWERMEKLGTVLSGKSNIRLVGSSFGGLMAALFAIENESRVEKLILLAPAIHMMETSTYTIKKISVPVHIYHGKNDGVIPLDQVERAAGETFLNLSFHAPDDDHFLHKTFKTIDWVGLLG
ncbi:MAG: alpha/beta hydrolase [Deltaproteobacteria bacterium]|nr:alpha/beta hydrolase [Deltaproteobacteria bacterium]